MKVSNGVKKKKKRSYKKSSERKKMHAGARTALACMGIVVCLLLLGSCMSFDIGDWPSRFVYPHNEPTANWCGYGEVDFAAGGEEGSLGEGIYYFSKDESEEFKGDPEVLCE